MKYRYIEQGHGDKSLTKHETDELAMDFDIDTKGLYILVALTKDEWLNKCQHPNFHYETKYNSASLIESTIAICICDDCGKEIRIKS